MEQIKTITNGKPWIATGDRNMIGTNEEVQEVYECFFKNTMNVKDYRDAGEHYGSGTSWIGFSTDKFKNPIKEDGTFQSRDTLCATFYCPGDTNILKGIRSANLLGEFDVNTNSLLPNANKLTKPEMRTTISDHAALVFHFTFDH